MGRMGTMVREKAPLKLNNGGGNAALEDKAVHMTELLIEYKPIPDILSYLTEAELAILLQRDREKKYAKGELILRQGDTHEGIQFIRSGRIRSFYVSPAGREITLAYWSAGHFIGAPQIYGGGEHMRSSMAMEPSVGLWLPGNVLHELIREIPNLAIGVIEGLVYKGKLYTALLQIMGTRSITMRLAHLRLTLADVARPSSDGLVKLVDGYTQQEMANMIGATRQSVSLTMDRFEKDGLISRHRQAVQILNVGRLEEICF